MPPRQQTKKAGSAGKPARGDIKVVDGKRKFTPRAPVPAAERLPRLYRALTDQVNDGVFDNAKKTCKRILALDPASSSAFQTLLFIYLHTDDYASALALVENPPAPSPPPLHFERAYCLYRLHRENEALAEIKKITEQGRREQHLEAQIYYRLGEFEKAQEIYEQLLADVQPSSSEYEDIRTNQSATATQLDFITTEYKANLQAPAVANPTSGLTAYTPNAGELETHVPSVPIGWVKRGTAASNKPAVAAPASTSATAAPASTSAAAAPASTSAAPDKNTTQIKHERPRHNPPKGAKLGEPFTEDPERWLPMRQRSYYVAPASKKKKEQTGFGTQGATGGDSGQGGSGGGGGGGGRNKKKGKKK